MGGRSLSLVAIAMRAAPPFVNKFTRKPSAVYRAQAAPVGAEHHASLLRRLPRCHTAGVWCRIRKSVVLSGFERKELQILKVRISIFRISYFQDFRS